jgi:hypothetical protein
MSLSETPTSWGGRFSEADNNRRAEPGALKTPRSSHGRNLGVSPRTPRIMEPYLARGTSAPHPVCPAPSITALSLSHSLTLSLPHFTPSHAHSLIIPPWDSRQTFSTASPPACVRTRGAIPSRGKPLTAPAGGADDDSQRGHDAVPPEPQGRHAAPEAQRLLGTPGTSVCLPHARAPRQQALSWAAPRPGPVAAWDSASHAVDPSGAGPPRASRPVRPGPRRCAGSHRARRLSRTKRRPPPPLTPRCSPGAAGRGAALRADAAAAAGDGRDALCGGPRGPRGVPRAGVQRGGGDARGAHAS